MFALLVSNWTHYNYRNTHLKFNSSLWLSSLGMLYETEDNNLTFLSQHPLHLRSNFLLHHCGSIKGIFVSFVSFHFYKAIRSRDTVVGTLIGLQAERLRYRGTIPGGGNWFACHCLFFFSFCSLLLCALYFTHHL